MPDLTTADVVIVGGGYTGLWTALRMRELAPETRVMVLEADFCGSGASGRNGGQLHTWWAEVDLLSAVVGVTEARELCAATADVIDELQQLQDSGAVDMDLRLDGWLWTASSLAQEGAWDRAVAMTADAGEKRFEPLDGATITRRTGSSVSYTGVVEEHAGTVQPAKLAVGLRDLAISRGVVVHESSPVLSIEPGASLHGDHGPRSGARRPRSSSPRMPGCRRCPSCASTCTSSRARSSPLHRSPTSSTASAGPTAPRSATRSCRCSTTSAPATDASCSGGAAAGIAFRGDFGADFNRNPEHGRDNLRELHRVYPQLRGIAVDYDWSGPIDCVPEHVPVFDHLRRSPNILYGMGFNGTGIAQTPIGGSILASLALERDDRWSNSGLVGVERRSTLPPEPFRYIGREGRACRCPAQERRRDPQPACGPAHPGSRSADARGERALIPRRRALQTPADGLDQGLPPRVPGRADVAHQAADVAEPDLMVDVGDA